MVYSLGVFVTTSNMNGPKDGDCHEDELEELYLTYMNT